MKFDDIKYLVQRSFKEWSQDKASRLAAALAYYTVFSIPPLLIIGLAVASRYFGPEAAQEALLREISSLAGSGAREAIELILENVSNEPRNSIIATTVSVFTLLLGGSGVFAQLQGALNTVWEVVPKPGRGLVATLMARFFSFAMVGVFAFLLLVSLVISAGLASLNEFVNGLLPQFVIVAQILNTLISLVIVTVVFAFVFKVVPDVKIAWSDVWVGAFVTAVLFTVGKWAIGLYLGNSAPASTYGAAGSLIVLLLWVYYTSQIIFLGAEFTQAYANKFGSRIVADEDAIALAQRAQPTPQPAQLARVAQARNSIVASEDNEDDTRPVPPRPGPYNAPSPAFVKLKVGMTKFQQNLISVLAVPMAAWLWVRGQRQDHSFPADGERIHR